MPRQEPRHRQADVTRIFRFAQRAPGGVLGSLKDLGQIARIAQFLPRFHLHHGRIGGGNERRVRRRRDLHDFLEHAHVGRTVIEVIVADQAAIGLAAELAVFVLVNLLENRALVPGDAFEFLERLVQARSWRCSKRGF